MIITISQTASNIKQTYSIEGEDFYLNGELGEFSRLQKITLSGKENTVTGVHSRSNWVNYIPLRYIFGAPNLTRGFDIYKNGEKYGHTVFSKHGLYKSFYVIALYSGEIFHCYRVAKESFEYVSIYSEDRQIALIETYLNTSDYKYTHKLYVLEDYNEFADIFSFFTLYYANYHFLKRFHMSKSSVCQKSWTFSKYNSKYDPKWREENFPNENFFGRINLF